MFVYKDERNGVDREARKRVRETKGEREREEGGKGEKLLSEKKTASKRNGGRRLLISKYLEEYI